MSKVSKDEIERLYGFPLTCPKKACPWTEGWFEKVSRLGNSFAAMGNPFTSPEKHRPLNSDPMHSLASMQLGQGLPFKVHKYNHKAREALVSFSGASDKPFIVGCTRTRKPLVPVAQWKQLLRAVSEKCEAKQTALSHECLAIQEQVWFEINRQDHPVYIEALISGLLTMLTTKRWCPFYSILYGCERIDFVQFDRAPEQVLYRQACEQTLLNALNKDDLKTTPTMLATWLFQICFALAYAQNMFGFIHGDLTPLQIGLKPIDTSEHKAAVYLWNDQWFTVPTTTHSVCIQSSEASSIVMGDFRLYASSEARTSKTKPTYKEDLFFLGGYLVSNGIENWLIKQTKKYSALGSKREILACEVIAKLVSHWSRCDKNKALQECSAAFPAHQHRWFAPLFGSSSASENATYVLDERSVLDLFE